MARVEKNTPISVRMPPSTRARTASGRSQTTAPERDRAQRGAHVGALGGQSGCGFAPAVKPAPERRHRDEQRKRKVQHEEADEGQRRDQVIAPTFERAPRHAQQRMHHDGRDRRLDPQQQRLRRRGLSPEGIDDRKREDHQRAGDHEQQARDKAAAGAMQLPPGIGGKLHRLGPGQQHAERQGAQEFLSVSHLRSSTSSRCISAICAAGPPNDSNPMRRNTRVRSDSEGGKASS